MRANVKREDAASMLAQWPPVAQGKVLGPGNGIHSEEFVDSRISILLV